MNIGEAARASGVSTKMIRYYELIGLVLPASRTGGNYRSFSEHDVNDLRFVQRARSLGLSIETIADLLSLWRDKHRAPGDIGAVVTMHLTSLHARMRELQGMIDTLVKLVDGDGSERSGSPILAEAPSAQDRAIDGDVAAQEVVTGG